MTTVHDLNVGYDLDLNGDAWEDASSCITGVGPVFLWRDPKLDSFPYMCDDSFSTRCRFRDLREPVLFFVPDSYSMAWSKNIFSKGTTLTLQRFGTVNETDRSCVCHGQFVYDGSGFIRLSSEAVDRIEAKTGIPLAATARWKFTGNASDIPFPLCDRCDGSGSVLSPGGSWALYAAVS